MQDDESRGRRSVRLPAYDYASPGAYFLTLCTHARRPTLGAITDGRVRLTPAGDIVTARWHAIPRHFPHVALDAFVVMPNHMHGIIIIEPRDQDVGARHARDQNISPSDVGARQCEAS